MPKLAGNPDSLTHIQCSHTAPPTLPLDSVAVPPYLAEYLQSIRVLTLVARPSHLLHVTDAAQGHVQNKWILTGVFAERLQGNTVLHHITQSLAVNSVQHCIRYIPYGR